MESNLMPCRCGGNAFMSDHKRDGSEYAAYEIKCEKCGKRKRWNYHMSDTDQGKQYARDRLSELWNSEVSADDHE